MSDQQQCAEHGCGRAVHQVHNRTPILLMFSVGLLVGRSDREVERERGRVAPTQPRQRLGMNG